MNPLALKAIAAFTLLALAFTSGWVVHGWKYGAEQRAAEKDRADAYVAAVDKADKASAALDKAVATLQENRFITIKELHHETSKIEYRCVLPDAGRVLFNKSAAPADTH